MNKDGILPPTSQIFYLQQYLVKFQFRYINRYVKGVWEVKRIITGKLSVNCLNANTVVGNSVGRALEVGGGKNTGVGLSNKSLDLGRGENLVIDGQVVGGKTGNVGTGHGGTGVDQSTRVGLVRGRDDIGAGGKDINTSSVVGSLSTGPDGDLIARVNGTHSDDTRGGASNVTGRVVTGVHGIVSRSDGDKQTLLGSSRP